MPITRDRLGRFSSNSGGKGGSKRPQSRRQNSKSWNKNEQTLDQRMKGRLQKIQSNQVSNVMKSGKRGAMSLASRIMAAQRKGKQS